MSKKQQNDLRSVTPRRTRSGRVSNQEEKTIEENKQKSKQTKSRKNPQRPTAVTEHPSLETTTENYEDGQQHPTAEDPTMNSRLSSSATSRRCTRRSSKRKPSSSIIAEDDQETTEALNDEQSTEENIQQQSTEEVNQQQLTSEDDQQPSTSSENSEQLPILSNDQDEQNVQTTEDSTIEIPNGSIIENVIDIEDSITENQNLAVPVESINNYDDYVILSDDDDDDFVIVPSEDEEDPRIIEAVQILEGNLSLNAPSSPSLSPTPNNRTIDLTDSPKASPMPIFMDSPDPPPSSNQESSLQIKCPICFDTFVQIKSSGKRLMSTICGHIFCSGCLPVCVKTAKNCPSCRKTLKLKDIHPIFF